MTVANEAELDWADERWVAKHSRRRFSPFVEQALMTAWSAEESSEVMVGLAKRHSIAASARGKTVLTKVSLHKTRSLCGASCLQTRAVSCELGATAAVLPKEQMMTSPTPYLARAGSSCHWLPRSRPRHCTGFSKGCCVTASQTLSLNAVLLKEQMMTSPTPYLAGAGSSCHWLPRSRLLSCFVKASQTPSWNACHRPTETEWSTKPFFFSCAAAAPSRYKTPGLEDKHADLDAVSVEIWTWLLAPSAECRPNPSSSLLSVTSTTNKIFNAMQRHT